MTTPKLGQWVLNGATALVTICALVVAALRVHELTEPAAAEGVVPRTRTVENWHEFTEDRTRLGPASAPVTIVEFLDFQCHFCRIAARDLDAVRREYPDEVAVVYRHLPIHKFARSAALAVECASRVGRFKKLHDLLFEQIDSIGVKSWSQFALEAGIRDTTRFGVCLNEPSIVAVISRDSSAAVSLGVDATPTFLINELMVIGNPGAAELKRYVSAAIKRSQQ